jgi:glutamyl-tRNA reductase
VRRFQQAKSEDESLIVTSTLTEQKFTDLQNTFSLIKLICENSQGSVEEFQK